MEKDQRLKVWTPIVKDWLDSGLTKKQFAQDQGLSYRAFLRYAGIVMKENPTLLPVSDDSGLTSCPLIPVPSQLVVDSGYEAAGTDQHDSPVMMLKTEKLLLQVTNGVTPDLLKTAMEVMLAC